MKAIMKTMKYFLSMAALALVGAMTVSCSSDDNIIDQPQQQEVTKNNVVTLTTTVSLDGGATTRALTSTGVKTFAVGETMAIYYWKNKGNDHEKAVSAPLTAGDITNGGKSATFTFTLDNPYKDMSVSYVYPAAMANADFTPNYDALYNNQDGSLATLASNFDFCTKSGAWDGDNLPTLTLENQLAILAINLKNGSTDITSTITGMTLGDGTNTYSVTRDAAAGPIYVAIRPTSSATIDVTATDGTNEYRKTLSGKTYDANNGYNVTWNMSKMTTITWNSSNISDLHVDEPDAPYENEGITLSANADYIGADWYESGIRFNMYASGGYTFTAPSGKKFTKIEMTLNGSDGWDNPSLGTGWEYFQYFDSDMIYKVTWTGTAANTVGLLTGASSFEGATVKSIVFTVY